MMGLGKGGSGFKYGHFWYVKFPGGTSPVDVTLGCNFLAGQWSSGGLEVF